MFDVRDLSKPLIEIATSRPSHCVAFSILDGNLLALGDDAGALTIINTVSPSHPLMSVSFNDFVRGLSWSALSNSLLVASWGEQQQQLKLVNVS